MVRAERLAARRNEIAHGIVKGMPLTGEPKFPGWGLRPSEYASNKNVPYGSPRFFITRPKYIYTSAEINSFADAFLELVKPINGLWLSVRREQQRAQPKKI
jgi:hypothetical protein